MKLASGSAPVVEMNEMGITMGLGTDGAASNNNLNMFDEMDAVAKYYKALQSDPTVMPAGSVVKMATVNGATVLQKPAIGSLAVGKTADIIMLDLKSPNLVPLYNIYSQLVYSAGGSEVDSVIINGELVMENRKLLTIDEDEAVDKAIFLSKKIGMEVKHG